VRRNRDACEVVMWLATTPAVARLQMCVSGTEEGTRLELIWQPVNLGGKRGGS
jgi:hypothetical protein